MSGDHQTITGSTLVFYDGVGTKSIRPAITDQGSATNDDVTLQKHRLDKLRSVEIWKGSIFSCDMCVTCHKRELDQHTECDGEPVCVCLMLTK